MLRISVVLLPLIVMSTVAYAQTDQRKISRDHLLQVFSSIGAKANDNWHIDANTDYRTLPLYLGKCLTSADQPKYLAVAVMPAIRGYIMEMDSVANASDLKPAEKARAQATDKMLNFLADRSDDFCDFEKLNINPAIPSGEFGVAEKLDQCRQLQASFKDSDQGLESVRTSAKAVSDQEMPAVAAKVQQAYRDYVNASCTAFAAAHTGSASAQIPVGAGVGDVSGE